MNINILEEILKLLTAVLIVKIQNFINYIRKNMCYMSDAT